MSAQFDTWPHDAEGIIREALREYVGDGDGEDGRVFDAALKAARAEGWDEGAATALNYSYRQPDGITLKLYESHLNPHRDTGEGR